MNRFGSYDHKGTCEKHSVCDCIGLILGFFIVLFVVFGLFFLTLIGLSKFLLWLM